MKATLAKYRTNHVLIDVKKRRSTTDGRALENTVAGNQDGELVSLS